MISRIATCRTMARSTIAASPITSLSPNLLSGWRIVPNACLHYFLQLIKENWRTFIVRSFFILFRRIVRVLCPFFRASHHVLITCDQKRTGNISLPNFSWIYPIHNTPNDSPSILLTGAAMPFSFTRSNHEINNWVIPIPSFPAGSLWPGQRQRGRAKLSNGSFVSGKYANS
jgi:hypothetical protein